MRHVLTSHFTMKKFLHLVVGMALTFPMSHQVVAQERSADMQSDGPVTVYFSNYDTDWEVPHIHYWGAEETSYSGVEMEKGFEDIWYYACPAGTTGISFSDGDSTKTSDFAAVNGHLYSINGDEGEYHATGDLTLHLPDHLYIIGDLSTGAWTTDKGFEMSPDFGAGRMVAEKVEFVAAGTNTICFFNLATALGSDWDVVNASHRYGSALEGDPIALGVPAPVDTYPAGAGASACKSWSIAPGVYDIVIEWRKKQMTVKSTVGSLELIGETNDFSPVYYNLQGVKVESPADGLYIVRRGDKVTKELVR